MSDATYWLGLAVGGAVAAWFNLTVMEVTAIVALYWLATELIDLAVEEVTGYGK